MDYNYTNEMYEILDDMNAQIEVMINGIITPKDGELILAKLHEKTSEFLDSLEQEIEKMGFLDMSY